MPGPGCRPVRGICSQELSACCAEWVKGPDSPSSSCVGGTQSQGPCSMGITTSSGESEPLLSQLCCPYLWAVESCAVSSLRYGNVQPKAYHCVFRVSHTLGDCLRPLVPLELSSCCSHTQQEVPGSENGQQGEIVKPARLATLLPVSMSVCR